MRGLHAHLSLFLAFNDTATTELYTLSLHDALPISSSSAARAAAACSWRAIPRPARGAIPRSTRSDRKSTRLNSSHTVISYAVFCLKKKKKNHEGTNQLKPFSIQMPMIEENRHDSTG